jgi:putative transposase
LGLKTFALSDGTQVKSPDYSKSERKIRKLQRRFARQQKDPKRRHKTRIQIAKLYNLVTDTRKDFLHKLSTKIVNENQMIVLEELNVSGLVKNRRLARAISSQGGREFREFCEAKSDKFSQEFKVISRWETTSQVCSKYDHRWGKFDLKVRTISCLSCSTTHDRDENAAKNINKVGIRHCHDSLSDAEGT